MAWFPKRWQNMTGQRWQFSFPFLNPCRWGQVSSTLLPQAWVWPRNAPGTL